MRILLIDPPFYRLIGFYNRYFPLGLVSVGTSLRAAGHKVAVYDADCNDEPSEMDYGRLPDHYQTYLDSFRAATHPVWSEVGDTIRRFRPDVVGISIWTAYAASAFRVAEISKAIDPACPVVVGGVHATVRAAEVLRVSWAVDYVVRGEGEATVVELADMIARGDSPVDVEGVSFRQCGAIRHNPGRNKIQNLAALPVPDRSLLMNEHKYSSEDMGLIMTSRGCPFSCSFCVTETRQVRYRPIEHILAEIRRLRAEYGTIQFSFKDDSFTVDRQRVTEFCDALVRDRLNIRWECNSRVDLVTDEMLRRMKKAGCNSIKIGIESGSQDVLERMNKGITLDQIRQAAKLLRHAGIHWTGYFLIGTPGETEEDVYKTLELVYEIKPDFASIGVYEPFPGTAMFEEGLRRGLVKADMMLEDFYTISPNNYYRAGTRCVDTMDPSRFASLEAEMKAKFHAYNRRMGRLLKRARSRTGLYLNQPVLLLTDMKKYLSWI